MTESDYRKMLGRRIADLRKRWRLSQSDLAEKVNEASEGRLHLTQNAISRLEVGARTLPLLEGVYLAAVLRTNVETLAGVVLDGRLYAWDPEQVGVACDVCGVIIGDLDAHKQWHRDEDRLQRLIGEAETLVTQLEARRGGK